MQKRKGEIIFSNPSNFNLAVNIHFSYIWKKKKYELTLKKIEPQNQERKTRSNDWIIWTYEKEWKNTNKKAKRKNIVRLFLRKACASVFRCCLQFIRGAENSICAVTRVCGGRCCTCSITTSAVYIATASVHCDCYSIYHNRFCFCCFCYFVRFTTILISVFVHACVCVSVCIWKKVYKSYENTLKSIVNKEVNFSPQFNMLHII